jgi:hypothetical protein
VKQDAIIGRAVRQLRDVKEKLAQLKSKANAMGATFSTISQQLYTKPELLRFVQESTDPRFIERIEDWNASRGSSEPNIPSKEDVDIGKVLAIRDEMRANILEKERLEKSLKDMGYSSNL